MLNVLFNKSKSEIQNIYGIKRRIVDFLIAGSILKRNYKYLLKNSLSLLTDTKISPLSLFKPYKFVYFKGSIFVDCFAPKWPGKIFDHVIDILIRNIGKKPEDWVPFILSLVFSITKKCVYRCEHCYAISSLGNKDIIPLKKLLQIAKDFQKIGVGIIAWEGGEPLLRFDDLITLVKETHDKSEAWLATTAYGLNYEKAQRLKEAGLTAAIISLDHYDPDKHNKFRGNKKAFDMAINGVQIFRENGILPSLCLCATKDIAKEEELFRYLELAKAIGAAFIQILDATPSGNYLGKNVILSHSQLQEIKQFHIKVNTDPQYRNYPSISARALLEDDDHYGCCAGSGLCYVDSSGNLQACDLLQISFGNVIEEGVESVFRKMKRYFPHPLSGRCPAQTLYQDIAEVFNEIKILPLPYKNCTHILNKISERGLPIFSQTKDNLS